MSDLDIKVVAPSERYKLVLAQGGFDASARKTLGDEIVTKLEEIAGTTYDDPAVNGRKLREELLEKFLFEELPSTPFVRKRVEDAITSKKEELGTLELGDTLEEDIIGNTNAIAQKDVRKYYRCYREARRGFYRNQLGEIVLVEVSQV